MNKLTLILALMIFCASVSNVNSQCSVTDCNNADIGASSGTKAICAALTTFLNCLKNLTNDVACSDAEKNAIEQNIRKSEGYKKALKCASVSNMPAQCNVTDCTYGDVSPSSDKEASCAAYTTYLTCLKKLESDVGCSAADKISIKEWISLGEELKKTAKCANVSNVASQCSVNDCPDPGEDFSWRNKEESCAAATTFLNCLKKSKNDVACNDAEKNTIEQKIFFAEEVNKVAECGVSGLMSSPTMSLVLASLSFFLTKIQMSQD